jgi:histidinol-phosphate aminotransferase
VLTVLDQAYCDYVEVPDYPSGVDDLRAGRNVIVLRTFSKVHALAGLRIGYGIAAAQVIDALHRTRLPFNVNSLALAAALAALEDVEHVAAARRRNGAELEFLTGALRARGLRVIPSVANFILVDVPGLGREIVEGVARRGVMILGMESYGLPNSVRITVGTREENQILLAALDQVLEGQER